MKRFYSLDDYKFKVSVISSDEITVENSKLDGLKYAIRYFLFFIFSYFFLITPICGGSFIITPFFDNLLRNLVLLFPMLFLIPILQKFKNYLRGESYHFNNRKRVLCKNGYKLEEIPNIKSIELKNFNSLVYLNIIYLNNKSINVVRSKDYNKVLRLSNQLSSLIKVDVIDNIRFSNVNNLK